jgi:hypothetical protein
LAKSTPPESIIKQPTIRWYSYKKERAANVTIKRARLTVQKSITPAARNNKARSRDRALLFALVCKHGLQWTKSAHSKKAFPIGKAFKISGGADDRYKQVRHTPSKLIIPIKIMSLY